MDYEKMSYIELFKLNYSKQTEEAIMVMNNLSEIKTSNRSTKYAKWGLMEYAMKLQDPKSSVEIMPSSSSEDPMVNLVHTQEWTTKTLTGGAETYATTYAHFVILKATFKGEVKYENYPVLDNTHKAVKFPSQFDINNAIQRGTARLISRLTGIAFELYTGYEVSDGEEVLDIKKTETVKAPVKETVKTPVKETVKEPVNVEVKETVKEPAKVEVKETVKDEPSFILANILKQKEDHKNYPNIVAILNKTLGAIDVAITKDMTVETTAEALANINKAQLEKVISMVEAKLQ